jgi:glycosyltransferase involved in cell wall biosynthesis
MVMPTFFGPTNIPPLEAFATGCPAAVSNIYGMPEQIGEAALFFDPVSDAEISGALLRLWTDDALCEELSARGLTRLAQRDQDCFNQRLLSILRGLA